LRRGAFGIAAEGDTMRRKHLSLPAVGWAVAMLFSACTGMTDEPAEVDNANADTAGGVDESFVCEFVRPGIPELDIPEDRYERTFQVFSSREPLPTLADDAVLAKRVAGSTAPATVDGIPTIALIQEVDATDPDIDLVSSSGQFTDYMILTPGSQSKRTTYISKDKNQELTAIDVIYKTGAINEAETNLGTCTAM
jgi:hypothetical protein